MTTTRNAGETVTRSSHIVRGGSRALIGLALTAAGALLIVNLDSGLMPTVTREAPVIEADATQTTLRTVVCSGPFGELGADASQPQTIVPVGEASIVLSDPALALEPLTSEPSGAQPPAFVRSDQLPPVTAAQVQLVGTTNVRGLAAHACQEPSNEQWLVGGSTVRGTSSTLTIGNPGAVPATVRVTVYDENGRVDVADASGVLVPPQSQRSVSLNGYGAGRASLVAHVSSIGAPVVSVLGVAELRDITPVGADQTSGQYDAANVLVFPGASQRVEHLHAETDAQTDQYPAVGRLFAPGDAGGSATFIGVTDTGERQVLAEVSLAAGVVVDTALGGLTENFSAVVVEASVPVVGGLETASIVNDAHDIVWHAPAPRHEAGTPSSVAVAAGGSLVIANLGNEQAEVTIADSVDALQQGQGQTHTLAVGAAATVPASSSAVLQSTQPFAAAVTVVQDPMVSSYPVMSPLQQLKSVRVYPR